jgi:N,N'-diacetyllegionaminate synthase
MELFGKNLDASLAVIAEIGVNHEGNIDQALKMIAMAKEAGADAVKFQSYTPGRYQSANNQERLQRVTKFSLDEAAHDLLWEKAKKEGIAIFSTPLTEDWVPFLSKRSEVIKIASGDLTFEPVIRAATKTGKKVIISTGFGNIEEINRAVNWAKDEIGETALSERLVLMHCVSAYPTPIEQANILSVPFLKDKYPNLTIGYSNHVIEPEACLAAVALGAAVVEVHFTDQKEGRSFRDHSLSFTTSELKSLIRQIRNVKLSLGVFGKTAQKCEVDSHVMRKGLILARDMQQGDVLTKADIIYARPATYYSAAQKPELIGKTLKVSAQKGQSFAPEMFE